MTLAVVQTSLFGVVVGRTSSATKVPPLLVPSEHVTAMLFVPVVVPAPTMTSAAYTPSLATSSPPVPSSSSATAAVPPIAVASSVTAVNGEMVPPPHRYGY